MVDESGARPDLGAAQVARLRADTPAVDELIHLNNAGASLPPRPVLDAVIDHLQLEARIGGYEAADAASDAVDDTYSAIATLLGADRDEIAVVENATVGWQMAFHSVRFRPGDRILTTTTEYASNFLSYLRAVDRHGVTIDVVPDDEHGQVDVDALTRLLDDDVRLVSINHVPTNGGLVNPAAAIGRAVAGSRALFLLDACQSVGQLPIDVSQIGCDMLSFTGRKYVRAPRGTGALFVRRDRLDDLDPPMIDLHSASWTAPNAYSWRPDARRFENWESNVAATIGLGVAARYALGVGMAAISRRITALANDLRARLDGLEGVTVRDLGVERCGIVTFTVDGVAAPDVSDRLRRQAINTSVSGTSSTRIDMERRGLDELVRASVHAFNTTDELDRAVDAIAEIASAGSS